MAQVIINDEVPAVIDAIGANRGQHKQIAEAMVLVLVKPQPR